MRHRCVEVAAPYKLHVFCRQTISALLHRIHIVTPNTEKLIPKNRQSENCPCHLRDTGSVQLCFELLDYDLTLNISILEIPVAIGAVPCTLEGRFLQPEVVVVCNGDASIILGHDLLSLVESIKVSL